MTDRAQPGAIDSLVRNYELGDALGQFSDGWVVPADEPTASAQRSDLDESAFTAFDQTSSSSSLTVTIGSGEAFVNGWLATDTATDVDLAASTAGQTVGVSWDPDAAFDPETDADRDAADRVVIALEGDVSSVDPFLPLWTFDTDGSGVTSVTDERRLGPAIDPNVLAGADIGDAKNGEFLKKASGGLSFSDIITGAVVQDTEPTDPNIGLPWFDTTTGILYIYGSVEGAIGWYPIPNTQVLDETTTFNESGVTTTTDGVGISDGNISLIGSPYGIENSELTSGTFTIDGEYGTDMAWSPDGTELFVSEYYSDRISHYTLSTGFDVTTATYVDSLSIDGVNMISASPDGTHLYYFTYGGANIKQYNLSTGWDLSTATLTNNEVAAEGSGNGDINIKPDGTRLWMAGYFEDTLFEYDLSTAWDLSTATYNNSAGTITEPSGMEWGPDGEQLLLNTLGGSEAKEFKASTAWDITTLSDTGNRLSAANNSCLEFNWNDDGTKLIESDSDQNQLIEHDIVVSYDGNALVEWDSGAPTEISSWDLVTYDSTPGNGTVEIDVEDGNNNVLFSDIDKNFNISTLSNDTNVKIRAKISRPTATDNPTFDYAARRYTK